MPHDLEILCDTIDMWSFQFRSWSTITPKNFALVTLCIASLCKIHVRAQPITFHILYEKKGFSQNPPLPRRNPK